MFAAGRHHQLVIAGATCGVTVRCLEEGAHSAFGSGDQLRIFLPYQRAHEAVGVTPSLGFGLAVSRHLAQLMGGDLVYHRRDEMNFFELTLPIAPDHAG